MSSSSPSRSIGISALYRVKKHLRTTAACYLPALILSVIASVQLFHSQFRNLTPWKGGGFGMFSTMERIEARFLKAYLIEDNGREHPVFVPKSFWREDRSLRAEPNEEKMKRLAQRFVAPGVEWSRTREAIFPIGVREISTPRATKPLAPDSPVLLPKDLSTSIRPRKSGEPLNNEAEPIDAQSVRLELWRYTIDRSSNALSATLWMETTQSRRKP